MPEKIGLVADLDLVKWDAAVQRYLSSVQQMKTASQGVSTSIGGSYSNLGKSITNSTNGIASTVGRVFGGLGRTISNSLMGVGGIVGSVFGGITGTIGSVGGGIGGLIVGGLSSALSMAGSLLGNLAGLIGRGLSGIVGLFSSAFGGLANIVSGALGMVSNVIGNVLGGITKLIGGALNGITSLFSSVFGGLVSLVSGVLTGVVNIAGSLIRGLVGAITTGLSIITNLFTSVFSGLVNIVSGGLSLVTNIIGSAFSGIASAVSGALSGITSLVGAVFGVGGSIVSGIVGFGGAVVGVFGEMAEAVMGIIGDLAKGVLGAFTGLATSTVKTIQAMATDIYNSYALLGKNIVILMTAAAAGVTAAVVGAGRSLFNWTRDGVVAAIEFEQQMADIAAVLTSTRAEVQPLADLIDTMALDPKLVVSAEEASAAVEQLARNGLTMTDIIDGAARATVLLANSTGGDFQMSADVATMAMHMFNLEASELIRIADISQEVVNSSRMELDDWKLAMGNGGTVAAAYGVTLEQFAATIVGTVNNFHSARQAGTSLMNFVQRLVPITRVAAEEFQKLGLYTGLTGPEFDALAQELAETEDRIANLDPRLVHYDELLQAHTEHAEELRQQMVIGQNAFFDEEGNLRDLVEVQRILADATRDLTQEEIAEFVRRSFGNDAAETAIALIQMETGELQKLVDQMSKTGMAEQAAATRTATLAKRWENLQDIWVTIQRKSGAGFNDMLLNLVNRLTELTNQNQDRVITFFARMAELLDRVVTAAMPWVERMLPILIDNLEALASWLVEVALKGDRTEEWFNKMHPMLRGFIERIIQIVDQGKRFIRWIMEVGQTVRQALAPFIAWITENVTLRDALIAAAGAVAVFLLPMATMIVKMAAVGVAAAKAVSWIRKAWVEDFGRIRSIFEQVWPRIQAPLTAFVNNFLMGRWADAWDDAVTVVTTALGIIRGYLPAFFKPFSDLIVNVLQGDWVGAWRNVQTIALNVFNLIKRGLASLNHPFTDFILRVLEGRWIDAWRIVQRTAINALTYITNRLPIFFKPFGSFIINVLEGDWINAWEDVKQIAVNVYKAVVAGLESLNTPFTDFLANILEGKWGEAWEQVKNFAEGAFIWIKDKLGELNLPFTNFILDILEGAWGRAWKKVKRVVREVFEWIVEQLRNLDIPFTNFIADILEGKWASAWERVKNFAAGAFQWIKDRLRELNVPFTNFILDILEGRWGDAWEKVKNFATGAFAWIKQTLKDFETPFTDFLYNVLSGNWRAAWTQIQNFAVGVFEWLKDNLPGILSPLFDALIALVQGRWKDAWNFARTFAIEVFEEIREFFAGSFLAPILDLLVNVFEGDWQGAWYVLRGMAIDALYYIRDRFLPDVLDPLANMLINLIEGDWAAAWADAKAFAIGALELVKIFLPPWGDELVSALQSIIDGKWAEAWTHAKAGATMALEEVKAFLPPWGDELATALQLVLDGKWAEAWKHARAGAVLGLEEIKEYLPPWGDGLVTALQLILQGDWAGAWTAAKEALFNEETGLFPAITQGLRDLDIPFADFIADILEGKWGVAWQTAWDFLFGETGLISYKLPTALRELDLPFATFIADILEGKWGAAWETAGDFLFGETGILSYHLPEAIRSLDTPISSFIADILEGKWASAWEIARDAAIGQLDLLEEHFGTETVGPIVDFLKEVLLGNWPEAWRLAEEAFNVSITLIKDAWNAFYADVLTFVNDERFPSWIRAVALAFYAIHEAVNAAWGALTSFHSAGNDAFNNTDTWQENIEELAVSIRQLANVAESAFLAMQNFVIASNMIQTGDLFNAEKWAKMAENSQRIKDIWDVLREEGIKGGPADITLNTAPSTSIDEAMAASYTSQVYRRLGELRSTLQVEYLDMAEISALSGSNSIELFAQAFAAGTPDATSKVSGFANEVIVLAAAIKEGYYDAGSVAVGSFVDSLADSYGIAREGAVALANNIIATYGTRLTDAGGLTIPEEYKKTFVDPITGLQGPASDESYLLAQLMDKVFGTSLSENKGLAIDPAGQIVGEVGGIFGQLPATGYDIGVDAVGELGKGATDNRSSGIDPYAKLKEEIALLTGELVEYERGIGTDSVEALGTGAEGNKTPTLNIFGAISTDATAKTQPLVGNLEGLGGESVDALGTGAEGKRSPLLEIFGNITTDSTAKIEPLIGNMTDIGGDAASGMSNEVSVVGLREMALSLLNIKELIGRWSEIVKEDWETDGRRYMERVGYGIRDGIQFVDASLSHIRANSIDPWIHTTLLFFEDRGTQATANFAGGITSGIGFVTSAANAMGDAFKGAINAMLEIVINNFKNLATNITTMTDMNSFKVLGENIGNSFISGIDSKIAEAQTKAAELVNVAASSVETTAQIASPSRRFMRLGAFTGEGFLIGLEEKLIIIEARLSEFMIRTSSILENLSSKSSGIGKAQHGGGYIDARNGTSLGGFNDILKQQMNQKITPLVASSGGGVSHNYQNKTSSTQVGPVYINNQMDVAEFEYRVKNILAKTRQL